MEIISVLSILPFVMLNLSLRFSFSVVVNIFAFDVVGFISNKVIKFITIFPIILCLW